MRIVRQIAAAWLSLCMPLNGWSETLDPAEIVRRCDDLLRGGHSYCRLTMTITRPEWSRELTMEAWTEGSSNSFIRTLSPAKEKGVTFLKKGREAWQYVPSVDRTIKIPPSMMLQSWMGSDFTNDDVVRADSIVVDYMHAITAEPTDGGVDYWIIDAIPKPDAAVVWGKITMRIRKANFVCDRADYYDEDGKLIKFYETSEIRNVEGRDVATHFTMNDAIKPGNRTELQYRDLTFRPEVDAGTFTLQNMKR